VTVDYRILTSIARAAALAGARVLADRCPDVHTVEEKGGVGNLVTEVDVASERAIRDVICSGRPHDRITGEELADQGSDDSEVTWSIDPLDGTMNYVRGIPYFASSVAAYAGDVGRWVAGAVVAPHLGRTYWATRGAGAYLAPDGATQNARRLTTPPPRRSGALLGTGFSYDAGIRRAQYQYLPRLMESFVDLRRLGSAALEICAVADGSLDAYYEADLSVHDWAAAALIAEEAGLEVCRPTSRTPVMAVSVGTC
jgi:myo-inositol-1(or 4)-monophosphatase